MHKFEVENVEWSETKSGQRLIISQTEEKHFRFFRFTEVKWRIFKNPRLKLDSFFYKFAESPQQSS